MARAAAMALLAAAGFACAGPRAAPDAPASRETPSSRADPVWTPECLAVRGCDEPTLPRCAPGHVGVAVALIVSRAAELDGQRVVIDAPLRPGPRAMTAAACGPGHRCCNQATSQVVLGDEETHVAVGPRSGPDALQCRGDDSRVCCPFQAAGQRAVALGTLRSDERGLWLQDVQLCDPSF